MSSPWRCIDGKVTGAAAKTEMVKSKLPNNVLGKIWKLSDVDKDGMLDADEFSLAMHLMNVKLDGNDLPTELPAHLVPPNKRGGKFDGVMDSKSQFMYKGGEGINAGIGEVEWVVSKDRYKYDAIFDTLNPIDGKVTGAAAKTEMVKSKLPNNVLGKI